ncbi:class I SAM-dependent methyltransferase [Cyanothece sp. BG0011]|uniref:class I SAM-dependent methyltransferase n=1 Tax=Cyanothece sp. BG0011 TaxID=2082950 RepID=UPI000D1F1BC0|nr:class I SAM-dependent methyltransferase [Cyanothece sp. BG0011]
MITNFNKIPQTLLRKIIETVIGKEEITWYKTLNWEQAIYPFQSPKIAYPDYYTSVNYHGIKNGYLNPIAAMTYDVITPLATLPSEQWLRQCLLNTITAKPKNILDLGCGTGTNTINLKKRFPNAVVTGLDLSPYMLIIAEKKCKKNQQEILWKQGLAEATEISSFFYDLITISLLFHEVPNTISQAILQESLRLLKANGQLIILDANQNRLRHFKWLTQLFREPYSFTYAQGNIREWLEKIGFQAIKSKPIGGIYQITSAYKPE